jgi:hypothetical protein
MLQTNPDDPMFIAAVKHMTVGEMLEVADGILEVEYLFDVPSHFPFHQRIFEPGMILKKQGTNIRIYIEAEKLNMEVQEVAAGHFEDHQVVDGEVLPADRGEGYKEE